MICHKWFSECFLQQSGDTVERNKKQDEMNNNDSRKSYNGALK